MNTPEKLSRPEQARINGAKSHGPTSEEGKNRSKYNSLKHGFASASSNVLTIEDLPAWELHLEGCRSSFNPTSYIEQTLVDQLASISWRQSRLIRIETTLLELQISLQNEAIEQIHPLNDGNPAFHLALAWQGLARQPQKRNLSDALPPEGHDITSIELARRYIVSLDRQYRNVLMNLRQYQKDFAQQPAAAEPTPPPTRSEPEKTNEKPPAPTDRKPAATEIRPVAVAKPVIHITPKRGGR